MDKWPYTGMIPFDAPASKLKEAPLKPQEIESKPPCNHCKKLIESEDPPYNEAKDIFQMPLTLDKNKLLCHFKSSIAEYCFQGVRDAFFNQENIQIMHEISRITPSI